MWLKHSLIILLVIVELCYCYPSDVNQPSKYVGKEVEFEDTQKSLDFIYRNRPEMPNLIEGDILLTPEQAAIFKESGWEGLVRSEAWDNAARMWPNTIPYVIDQNIHPNVSAAILFSISLFEPTCVRFIPRGPDNMDFPYVRFTWLPLCATQLGMPGRGSRIVFLGDSCVDAIPAHELLHVLGRYHEQARPDRDQYVVIHSQNFDSSDPGTARQFELQPNADTLGLPYDYHSVMHYPSTAFQKAPGLLTITPVNPNISADELGQVERLTDLDIEHVNRRYCNETLLWPNGAFSLPKPKTGCPQQGSAEGYVYQDAEDDTQDPDHYNVSNPIHLMVEPDDHGIETYYCTLLPSNSNKQWPNGSYCIAKYGASCPLGFTEGIVFWDDENFDSFSQSAQVVPRGKYDCDTRIHYCCRSDGSIDTPIVLPTAKPFILLRQSADGCQQVQGMNVTVEWVYLDSEDDNNQNYIQGSAPYIEGTTDYTIYYCYYS